VIPWSFVALLQNGRHLKWYFAGVVVLLTAILAAAYCVNYLMAGNDEKVLSSLSPVSTFQLTDVIIMSWDRCQVIFGPQDDPKGQHARAAGVEGAANMLLIDAKLQHATEKAAMERQIRQLEKRLQYAEERHQVDLLRSEVIERQLHQAEEQLQDEMRKNGLLQDQLQDATSGNGLLEKQLVKASHHALQQKLAIDPIKAILSDGIHV
jgi:hypothetical protein